MNITKLSDPDLNSFLNNDNFSPSNFPYFFAQYIENDILMASSDNEEINGLIQFGLNSAGDAYVMKFVSVHPNFRKQGISKRLIASMINHILTTPQSNLYLSTYNTEEALISTVHSLATDYPELKIYHCITGGPYQLAGKPLLRENDLVEIKSLERSGKGKILSFIDGPVLKARVQLDDEIIIVETVYLTPIK